jgi:hypothetical protein
VRAPTEVPLSEPIRFESVQWTSIPNTPGVYVISDEHEIVYVGMAGRNGKGAGSETGFEIMPQVRS